VCVYIYIDIYIFIVCFVLIRLGWALLGNRAAENVEFDKCELDQGQKLGPSRIKPATIGSEFKQEFQRSRDPIVLRKDVMTA